MRNRSWSIWKGKMLPFLFMNEDSIMRSRFWMLSTRKSFGFSFEGEEMCRYLHFPSERHDYQKNFSPGLWRTIGITILSQSSSDQSKLHGMNCTFQLKKLFSSEKDILILEELNQYKDSLLSSSRLIFSNLCWTSFRSVFWLKMETPRMIWGFPPMTVCLARLKMGLLKERTLWCRSWTQWERSRSVLSKILVLRTKMNHYCSISQSWQQNFLMLLTEFSYIPKSYSSRVIVMMRSDESDDSNGKRYY